jgi:hypothetical protein
MQEATAWRRGSGRWPTSNSWGSPWRTCRPFSGSRHRRIRWRHGTVEGSSEPTRSPSCYAARPGADFHMGADFHSCHRVVELPVTFRLFAERRRNPQKVVVPVETALNSAFLAHVPIPRIINSTATVPIYRAVMRPKISIYLMTQSWREPLSRKSHRQGLQSNKTQRQRQDPRELGLV